MNSMFGCYDEDDIDWAAVYETEEEEPNTSETGYEDTQEDIDFMIANGYLIY